MQIQMRVVGLAMDPFHQSPIVILKDKRSADREDVIATPAGDPSPPLEDKEGPEPEDPGSSKPVLLPIWIGETEANSIAMALLGVLPPRPMTHDLLKQAIQALGGRLLRVVITDLRDNTFYAALEVQTEGGELLLLDARPSDAIALGLRFKADLFVEEVVAEALHAKTEAAPSPTVAGDSPALSDKDKWDDLLQQLSTDSLGKYKQ